MRALTRFFCAVIIAVLAAPSFAASFLVPTDRELVDRASAIVVGTVVSTEGRRINGRIETVATIEVSERLKGDLPRVIEVIEPGGQVGDRWAIVSAATQYAAGEKVLVFLGKRADGAWGSWGMALGKFSFEKRDGIERLVRTPAADIAALEPTGKSVEQFDRSTAFLQFIRDAVAGRASKIDYTLAPRLENKAHRAIEPLFAPGSSYVMTFGPPTLPVRWPTETTISYEQNQTDPSGTLGAALNAWGSPALYVSLANGGVTGRGATGGVDDTFDTIQFNYTGTIEGGESVLAYTWIYGSGATNTFAGEDYYNIIETDVLIGPGLSGFLYAEALTHELGHSLGFRHSNVASPAASNAVMNSVIQGNYGTNLQGWDLAAVQTVYGNGPQCIPISSLNITPSYTVQQGQSGSAQVTPVGGSDPTTYPVTYQWYQLIGQSWQAISGATSDTYTVPSVVEPVSLKAWAQNQCMGSPVFSAEMTITPVCNQIVIEKQPASQTITSGASANLTVQAVGTGPLSYEWYRGAKGDTSNRVGTNSASYNTGALTATTKYWVRINNPCGSLDSNEATITVSGGTCTPVSITTQPQPATVKRGTAFSFTVVAGGTAPAYQWYEGTVNTDESKPVTNAKSATFSGTATVDKSYWVKVTNSCGTVRSNVVKLTVTCAPPDPFTLSTAPQAQSGATYPVSWSAAVGAKSYELAEVESATLLPAPPDMTGKFVAVPATPTTKNFSHVNGGSAAKYYYYQAKAICDAANTRLSEIVVTGVLPAQTPTQINLNEPFGPGLGVGMQYGAGGSHTFQIKLMPGGAGKVSALDVTPFDSTFNITGGGSFTAVSPSSGTVPPTGVNVNVTVNTSGLPPGTTGTNLTVTTTTGGTTTTTNVPVSVNLVSPVTTGAKTPPPANAMVIPIVGHAQGALGSQFQSDIRITNTATQTLKYLLTYTPSRTDGTKAGKQTQFDMAAGKTIALDDVVKNWFSIGLAGESGLGVLEIRPLNFSGKTGDATVGQFATVVASRTYNVTSQGTFGQFIPGIPFRDFIGKTANAISLQQIALSTAYRTNVGLVEGSGAPATVEGRIYNSAGAQVGTTFVKQLGPAEHQQFSLSEVFSGQLPDGRVEFKVTSDTGKVIGYASVLDNVTNDPLLVFPVQAAGVRAKKWVVPGIADFNNGIANWRSDVRIFNASTGPVTANVTFYQQGASPVAVTKPITIAKGEVKVLDNILRSFYNKPNVGGAIHVTTANDTALVVTARTYDQRTSGTYGQFIPGVTPAESTGLGEKPLNLLQIEESARFRSHLGLAETGGGPVTVEITGIVPESTVAVKRQITLTPNEFTQQLNIMKLLNLPSTSNGRVEVKVISGTGRVTAYISAIDNRTQDPTYVPAQ